MSTILPLLVCLCGGVGASCRYLLDTLIKARWTRAFPMSTFVINLVAGLLAGVVAALAADAAIDGAWRLMLATGFLGGLSTFSTAINEMVTLAKAGRWGTAAGYCAVSVVVPVAAVAVGFLLIG